MASGVGLGFDLGCGLLVPACFQGALFVVTLLPSKFVELVVLGVETKDWVTK